MASSPITNLIVRIVTFILLLISFVILVTTSQKILVSTFVEGIFDEETFRFNSSFALRYTLFTMIMGVLYTLLQIAFTIYHFKTGKPLAGEGLLLFDFYGDKIVAFTLATGVGAAFGAAVDMHNVYKTGLSDFFSKIYASTSLLLFGFVCTAVSSVLSSYSLPKHV